MRPLEYAKSFIAAIRAGAIAGRGFQLRDNGDMGGALQQALLGLSVLSMQYVHNANAPHASALISLTMLAEESAIALRQRGAPTSALIDSIALLKRMIANDPNPEFLSSLRFLEARLAAASSSPSAA